ncbi:MAG: SusD/RagB family nutrient-binding outer membrane lipoprotein [Candidatus Nephrothrix sp. EaCA]|nr:MAG: SusD/RagB family nutrient-binding outer membrane lipoprotein [Candidatus Nephrothrix sp. EaCA]
MKNIHSLTLVVFTLMAGSCKSYLDINENPNSPTAVEPKLILPPALTKTADVLNGYNSYGAQAGGYAANAGGYGGFGSTLTYRYTADSYSGLWGDAYDNLEDYQYIINKTQGDDLNIFFQAAAIIMRVHNFQLLVDAYNDVPYSKALLGGANLSPAYDKGAAIYAQLAAELDEAMAQIRKGMGLKPAPNPIKDFDVIFKGDMTKWRQLANTIKLRLMVRGTGKATFANSAFDEAGFLAADALINPGYLRDNNRQNPLWDSWAWRYDGAGGNRAWMPATFVVGFYDGNKISDEGRGKAVYYRFGTISSTPTKTPPVKPALSNQLGFQGELVDKSPSNGGSWYSGTDRGSKSAGNSKGVLKGPNAGFPLLTAAESYLLQAEALVRGMTIPGGVSAKDSFNKGIEASFRYLYSLPDLTQSGNYRADYNAYLNANKANPLVNFDLAVSAENKIEAIVTQKYIALNFIHCHEGWNEYRRTGYPVCTGSGAYTTFASVSSESTRADKLPSRILYPRSELQYNSANVPSGIDPFSSTIFWAK